LQLYEQALVLKKSVGDRAAQARTLNSMGVAFANLGEKQKARDSFTQALPLAQAVEDRALEANSVWNIAYIERDSGNLREALVKIEAALSIIESLRANIVRQDLRTSYF